MDFGFDNPKIPDESGFQTSNNMANFEKRFQHNEADLCKFWII